MNVRTPEIVTTTALAKALGLSGSRTRELASAGVFVRIGRGFDLEASRAAYMATLRKAATGRRGPGKSAGGDERARLARVQADAVELKNAVTRRELIPESEIESTWLAIVAMTRAAILASPSRIHADLPHLSAHDVSVVDKHLREALTRLSEGP
jgi:terminase small subunit / prophage DNA-packing protein